MASLTQPATLRDVPACLRILWAFTRATPWLPRVRPVWVDLALMARVIRRGWVRRMTDESGVAGFIARDGDRIHALYVHPRARGRGVGSALLNDAKAAHHRLELWVLQANAAARAFYAAHGFAEVKTSQGQGNDENLADVLMVWQGDVAPAPFATTQGAV